MDRDEAWKQLKFHLEKTQNQMVHYANAHKKLVQIKPGDWVLFKNPTSLTTLYVYHTAPKTVRPILWTLFGTEADRSSNF